MINKTESFKGGAFQATLVLLGMLIVLTLIYVQPSAEAQTIKLQTGCTHAPGGPYANTVNKFIELVKQKTNGQVIITNQYQALGVEQQLMQSVMAGSVDLGGITGGNAARFTNALMVTDLPFMFKKYENVFKIFKQPIGDQLKAKVEKDLNVKFLFPISHGSGRDVQTRNKPVKVPADIKGLKMRTVSSPMDVLTHKAWGANPSPVDWGQTYTSLQQGLVDGMAVDLGIILPGQWYEVVKYNIRLDYQAIYSIYAMNRNRFDSLSPAHQKAIMEAAQEAAEFSVKEGAAYVDEAIKKLAGHGHIIHIPTPQEYAQWAAVREGVWKEVRENPAFKGKLDMDLANEIYRTQ